MNSEDERFGVQSPSGFRVRRVLLALIVGFAFTGYVQRTSVAVAAQRMMPELGLTQVQVGWLFTAFLLTYSVFQLPGALVGQWLGGRRMLSVIGLATVVASVVTAIAPALATGGALFLGLLVARSLLGVAQAALFPVGAGMIRTWFPVGAWASAQALVVTGLWSGAAATPPLVAWLMEAHGWRWALVVTSVPSLALVVLWRIFDGTIDLKFLLSEKAGQQGVASMSRFQLLVFIFVIALSFFLVVIANIKILQANPRVDHLPLLPDVPSGVLGLLGISASSYAVSKAIQHGSGSGSNGGGNGGGGAPGGGGAGGRAAGGD